MIYLNDAALCPTNPDADQEVQRTLAEFKRHWYSDAGIEWYRDKVHACRQRVGALLQVRDPSTIAFTSNATTAHYLALSSLKWEPGDTILTTTHENPSIAGQLQALERDGVHVQAIRPRSPDQFLNELQDRVNGSRVKAIVMSHVSHVDGRIFPVSDVASLASAARCVVMIDGAQAVGHLPVDVESLDVDVYFFAGHKWCAGPLGTGALVVRDRFFTKVGSRGILMEQRGRPPASRFELGTHNIGLIAGLAKACAQRRQQGMETTHLTDVRGAVKETLGRTPQCRFLEWAGPHAPGILTFTGKPALDHGQLAKRLASACEIIVKPFVDYPADAAPAIRLSWSSTMNQRDLQKGVSQIAQLLES